MMTDHDVECYPPPECVCRSGGSLGILKEVQRLYEERLALIERNGGDNKMQLKVDTLKSWVCDLVSQNSLLIRVVEELESEATTRLLLDRKRHAERGCKDISCTSELKILNDSLQIENRAKEREIRRLSKETQQYENTITCLRKELSQIRYHTPRDHRDAEVMVGMCCTGQDCVREIPIRESGTVDESPFSSPSSAGVSKLSMDNVRVLREHNVALSKQVSGLRQSCAALQIQNKTAIEYAQFRDEIIKEMRRQLKCHKNKLRHIKEDCRFCDIRSTATSQDSGSQPYRRRRPLSLQRCVVDTTKYNHGDEGDKAHGDGSVEE